MSKFGKNKSKTHLHGFTLGAPVSAHSPKNMQVRWTGYSKLSIDVKVRVNGCLSRCDTFHISVTCFNKLRAMFYMRLVVYKFCNVWIISEKFRGKNNIIWCKLFMSVLDRIALFTVNLSKYTFSFITGNFISYISFSYLLHAHCKCEHACL